MDRIEREKMNEIMAEYIDPAIDGIWEEIQDLKEQLTDEINKTRIKGHCEDCINYERISGLCSLMGDMHYFVSSKDYCSRYEIR